MHSTSDFESWEKRLETYSFKKSWLCMKCRNLKLKIDFPDLVFGASLLTVEDYFKLEYTVTGKPRYI